MLDALKNGCYITSRTGSETMETKRDYYQVLGINRDAQESTIKKAYRKLAKKYHPDSNAGDPQAEQKFKEITMKFLA